MLRFQPVHKWDVGFDESVDHAIEHLVRVQFLSAFRKGSSSVTGAR